MRKQWTKGVQMRKVFHIIAENLPVKKALLCLFGRLWNYFGLVRSRSEIICPVPTILHN
jgi:hypothetical protein